MMERFAGDNKIMQQMAVNLENERQRNKQFIAELQQKQAEQTRRDVAAVYGDIIPFA
jgi:signal-transduction protein with cAMP-binding, CBS, and nucleotidyltransferase domain